MGRVALILAMLGAFGYTWVLGQALIRSEHREAVSVCMACGAVLTAGLLVILLTKARRDEGSNLLMRCLFFAIGGHFCLGLTAFTVSIAVRGLGGEGAVLASALALYAPLYGLPMTLAFGLRTRRRQRGATAAEKET